MKKIIMFYLGVLCCLLFGGTALAGPYLNDGIAGFVGPDGDGAVTDNNYVNPAFKAWATGVVDYSPSDDPTFYGMGGIGPQFSDPIKATGPVTGNNMDIVSLGDMDHIEIENYLAGTGYGPGSVTLSFDQSIVNGSGYDFAVFENAFWANAGGLFAELGYVEVSTDGINFARFDSVSLTPAMPGAYGTIDPTDVHNLTGKHANAYGKSWGTGFDLDDLLDNSLVLAGLVDLDNIDLVRVVDIPGNGAFLDSQGNPIYDAWVTWGSGGVDLEAIGVLNTVPIPGAIWLLGSGLLGLIGLKRKNT